jgi:SH3 domain protein
MVLMKTMKWYAFPIVFCLLFGHGKGLAQTMYVTDRLLLSFRSAPDPDQPAMKLLSSDTQVEVLATEGEWAEVKLEDGSTGWVMKRYLVSELPKSIVMEELKRELENKNVILARLEEEIASLKEAVSDQNIRQAEESTFKRKIQTLQNQIAKQKKRLEMSTKENTLKRLKEVYVTGIVALSVGLIIGYMVRRPKKKRQLFY